MKEDGIFIMLVVAFIAAVVFVGPYFTILAVNTLFGTGIEVTVGTWFAALWVNILLASRTIKK